MSLFAQWRNLPVVQKQRTVAHIRARTSRKRRFERCLETSDGVLHETGQLHVYGCFSQGEGRIQRVLSAAGWMLDGGGRFSKRSADGAGGHEPALVRHGAGWGGNSRTCTGTHGGGAGRNAGARYRVDDAFLGGTREQGGEVAPGE